MKEKLLPHLNFQPPDLRLLTNHLAKVDGLNLGQGICVMPVPDLVLEAAIEALRAGLNLYSPAQGIDRLREALAARLNKFNGIACSAENVTITMGSTGAFSTLCEAFLAPGDEVISFKPFYPYHHDTLTRKQANVRYIDIDPVNLTIDTDQIRDSISKRTKFILLNTPHNPTGKVFTKEELLEIAEICHKADIFCITDEVYEYITYDSHRHISAASLKEFEGRCITMGSYSKTFAITGWRIGYLVAPKEASTTIINCLDQSIVCAPTPFQHAVADGIEKLSDQYYAELATKYQRKRDKLQGLLEQCGMPCTTPQGAYYLLAHTSERFPGMTSGQVSKKLASEAKIGAVPATDFIGREFANDPSQSNFLRFCYAVPDERLDRAAELIKAL